MSDRPTPRTHAALKKTQGMFRASAAANGFAEFARQLERELAEANDHAALREKIEDLRGTFDGWQWDEGAGSSGWDKAIDAVLALIPTVKGAEP